ncbi:MAG: MFS transporter [Thermoplasmataceae archaeon]
MKISFLVNRGDSSQDVLKTLDESGLNRGHLKMMLVAGMGFFTDAYLLFILEVAIPILASPYGFNLGSLTQYVSIFGYQVKDYKVVEGAITSAALFGAFIGAAVLGNISDRFGRRAVYGLELGIMIVFTAVSAISPNYMILIISRFLMGIGVGGDYPISSTIMSEYSNVKHRGKLVALVFSMQGLGLLAGALVGLTSIYLLPLQYSWRFMLAFGIIPAIYVIKLRREMLETPRYSLQVKHDETGAEAAANRITGNRVEVKTIQTENVQKIKANGNTDGYLVTLRKYLIFLIGATMTWFIFDMAFYGTTLNNGFVLQGIGYSIKGSIYNEVFNIAIGDSILAGLFAVPGYFIAVGLIDIAGRKTLQWLGFLVMAASYFVIGFYYSYLTGQVSLFIIIFGLSYMFGNIGPNTTTFILPTELFPTKIRSTAHGIASSVAKLGAGIFTFLFLILGQILGNSGEFYLLSIISLAGAVITVFTIRETRGLSLEVTSLPPSEGIINFRNKWLMKNKNDSEKINKEEQLLPEGPVDQR